MSTTLRWWSLAGAALMVVGFGVAQQSGAFWRAESRLDGGTIRSGTLALRVGGASADSQSSSYRFDSFGGTSLGPSSVVQKPLTIRNAGDVTMRYRLQAVQQSSAALPLLLTVWSVPNEASCPASVAPAGTPLYTGPMATAQAPRAPAWAPPLAPAGTSVWCMRATVAPEAGADVTTTVRFDFLASST